MANGAGAGLIQHAGQIDGAYIDRSRNDLIRQAIRNGSTHIMFLDQDMIIPDHTLRRLLSHGVPYVGGSYWGKDDYFTPVSFHLDPFRRIYELEDCPTVETQAGGVGELDCWCGKADDHLHKVGGMGMGCTLLSTQMLQEMADYFSDNECPCRSPFCEPERWFSTMETGEDIHLAMRAKEMGIDRLLDGFVQCGHLRTQQVTRQHYEWAKQNAPRCGLCERVAFWKPEDEEEADKATRCWEHRDQ
jgi:hypothetical protein